MAAQQPRRFVVNDTHSDPRNRRINQLMPGTPPHQSKKPLGLLPHAAESRRASQGFQRALNTGRVRVARFTGQVVHPPAHILFRPAPRPSGAAAVFPGALGQYQLIPAPGQPLAFVPGIPQVLMVLDGSLYHPCGQQKPVSTFKLSGAPLLVRPLERRVRRVRVASPAAV